MLAQKQLQPDVLIAGGGIIGLSLALELHARGARVTILEARRPMRQASCAAAGMLAAHDPHNPPALLPLSELSLALYPTFLARLAALSGVTVPIQTEATVQYLPDNAKLYLAEQSIDPRQLAEAVLAAVRSTSIDLREHIGILEIIETTSGTQIRSPEGIDYSPQRVVHATGAWFEHQSSAASPHIFPRKGQMLRIALPPSLRDLREVHRAEHIYIVPRTQGPQAGTALIGATVEDAGFDTATHPTNLSHLRTLATVLLPALASETKAPRLEAWAGLRPATPDSLPLLGGLPGTRHQFVATGHFRNGILLAPATAAVLADLLEGKQPSVDLAPFAADRFRPA